MVDDQSMRAGAFRKDYGRESIKTDLLGWCEALTEIANPEQITDFLRSLRAVREFKRQPIPDDVVQDILEVARWSGSASNRQFAQIVMINHLLESLMTRACGRMPFERITDGRRSGLTC